MRSISGSKETFIGISEGRGESQKEGINLSKK